MEHLITADGLKPDQGKNDAVRNMPKPKDVKAVRRLCGFVNYLAKFLLRLSEVLEPIQELTRKEVPWQWQHEHDAAFDKGQKPCATSTLAEVLQPYRRAQCPMRRK